MAFKTLLPPDPFGREYPRPVEAELIENIPSELPDGMSSRDFHQTQPVLRTANEALGKLLFSPSYGLTYVAFRMGNSGSNGTVVVVAGNEHYRPSGHCLGVSGRELESSPQRGLLPPGPAPVLPDTPRICTREQIELAKLHQGYEPQEGTTPVGRTSPVPGVSLSNYLGNLPWRRSIADARGKTLHVHHLGLSVVPVDLAGNRTMECVVIGGGQLPDGTLVSLSWEEIRTAELLQLEQAPGHGT